MADYPGDSIEQSLIERRYRALVETSADVIWRTAPDGEVDEVMPSWARFTGQSWDAYRGWGWIEAVHADDRAYVDSVWREALAGATRYRCEYRLRRADGEWRLMDARGTPIFGDDGAIVEWVGANTDITDQRAAETKLRESEDHYRHAVELNPQTSWTAAPDGQLDHVGSRWMDWTGTTGLGSSWADGLHEDDRARTFEVWGRSVATGESYDIEHRMKMRDGSYRWVHSRAYPRRDEAGAIVKWYGSTEDVHDRKRAEARLIEGEERLRLVQAAGGIGSFDYDLQVDAAVCSHEYYVLHGLPNGAPINRETWTALIHPDDRDGALAALEASTSHRADFSHEYRIVRADDGAIRWLSGRARVIFDDSGRPWRFIGGVMDISDRVRSEIASRERAEELQAVLDAVPAAIWIARDPDSREIVGNAAANRLLRVADGANASLSADEAERPSGFKVFSEGRELAPANLPVQRAASGSIVANFEEEVRFDDGQVICLFGNAAPLRDPTGAIRGAVAAFVDVTEAKQIERDLRESDERFRALAAAIREVFYLSDLHARKLLYVSPAFETIWGMPVAELMARDRGYADSIHPEDQAAARAAYEKQAEGVETEVEYRIQRSDGAERWILDRSFPIRDEDGRPKYAAGTAEDITERKLTEQALRESEERFRKIADSAPVPMWVTQLDRKRSFVNQAYVDFVGLPRDEAADFDWRHIIHPDDAERILKESVAGEASLKPFTLVGRFRRGDGKMVWLRSVSQPRLGPDGEHAGFIGVAQDITDVMEAEAAIRESEAKLRLITDSLPVLISYVDRDGRYRFNNRAYEQWFGPSRADIAGKHMSEVLGEAAFDRIAPLVERALAGEHISAETELDYRDAGKRHVHLEYVPERSAGGDVTGFYVLVSDISAAKQAEDALRAASAQAEADAAERAAILQQLAEGVIVTDAEGRISFVNAAAAAIHGVARLDVQPGAYAETYHLFTEDGAPYPSAELPLARAVRDGGSVIDARWRIRRPDGSDVLAIGSAQPIRSADGVQIGSVLTLRDDTARRAAEEGLRTLNETLEARVAEEIAERLKAEETLRQAQKMEAIGQLTGGIAHDFNNLLTVILSSVDLLKRPSLDPAKQARYIDAIGDTANRAAALTNQLLAFARRQPLQNQAFDIGARLKAMEPMLRTVLGATIELSLVLDRGACLVDADPNQLDTAVLNMAVNARDAMPDGGALTIAASPAGDGQSIEIRVTDTGTGIAIKALATIFEPFYTTKSVGKGTGLGLSQVYGFAKQSGGEISVESELGLGATFTLRLPRSRRDAAPDGAQPQAAAPEVGSARVLVVEDNREVGEAAVRLLDDLGHRVVLARDAAEALDLVLKRGEAFDLVFSDVIMPGAIDGLGLARLLKEQRPELPVVLTTGYSHSLSEDAAHGFELLRKPYRADALMRLVARVVQKRS